MTRFQKWIVAAILVTLTGQADGAGSAAPSPSDDAQLIFNAARNAWASQVCPYELDYVIVVSATVNGTRRERHYRGEASPNHDLLHVEAMSAEEQRAPYTPHGIRFVVEHH